MEWEKCRRGTLVYRKNQDPDDAYTDGIVHKVIKENGRVTRLHVSFYRKDFQNGCKNRSMSIGDITTTPP